MNGYGLHSGAVAELVFWLGSALLSAGFLLRYGLALTGTLKDPVLRVSAQYGADDTYYVLPWVLLSASGLILSVSLTLGMLMPGTNGVSVVAILIGLLAYGAWAARDTAKRHPEIFCPLPLWYAHLRANTTREERRRIAFLWLRLPLRTRLRYNFSHHHFWLWVDLVVLGTVTQTMTDTAVEATGQWVSHDMEKRLYP